MSVTCDRSVVSPVSSNKTERHHITEIVLKVALNTINQTKPRWHLFIFQSTEHNYTFHALPPNKEYCSWTKTTCVMWGFAITMRLWTFHSSLLRLHGQLVPNIAWMMLRSYSIKIPHFVLMGQKNIANKGILLSDRPVYKKYLLLWNYFANRTKLYIMFWKSSTIKSSFHFDQTKDMTNTMYKNMSVCFCDLKSGLTSTIWLQ